MRLLVTGGTGGLGINVCKLLVERGYKVRMLVRPTRRNLRTVRALGNSVELCRGDITLRESLEKALDQIDMVVHMAAVLPPEALRMPQLARQVNAGGTDTLVEIIKQSHNRIPVIYTSSVAVFGPTPDACQPLSCDGNQPNPMDIYAASKQVVEWYHMLYRKICGLCPTSLRSEYTYGPRHQKTLPEYGVQNYLMRHALDNEPIHIYGDGSQKRELLYVDDVIECLLLLGENERTTGEIYAIGTKERVSFLELVQAIVKACGDGSYDHVPWPEDRKAIEVGDVITDFTKLTAHTGWTPTTPLSVGLKSTVEFYREHKKHYW